MCNRKTLWSTCNFCELIQALRGSDLIYSWNGLFTLLNLIPWFASHCPPSITGSPIVLSLCGIWNNWWYHAAGRWAYDAPIYVLRQVSRSLLLSCVLYILIVELRKHQSYPVCDISVRSFMVRLLSLVSAIIWQLMFIPHVLCHHY